MTGSALVVPLRSGNAWGIVVTVGFLTRPHHPGEEMPEQPDRTAAIRRADPAVLNQVVQEALPGLLRAARAAGLSRDQAEDAVQSALLVFVRRAAEFDGRARVTTWLHGILVRTIAETRRSVAQGVAEEPDDEVMAARFAADGSWRRPPEGPEIDLSRRDLLRMLADCMEGVPDRQRLAFTLREVEGFTTEEACKILGVGANNLGVLLFRARNRLRDCLEAKGVQGAHDAQV